MNILFVCTGNTCRSVMAEVISNELIKQQNISREIKVHSAGLSIVPGSTSSKNACLLMEKKFAVNINNRKAVQLTIDMIEDADLILTMTSNIKNILLLNFSKLNNNIHTLKEYAGVNGDIVDPYGGDIGVYEIAFQELEKYILLLMDKLKEDKSI